MSKNGVNTLSGGFFQGPVGGPWLVHIYSLSVYKYLGKVLLLPSAQDGKTTKPWVNGWSLGLLPRAITTAKFLAAGGEPGERLLPYPSNVVE